jgi:hypothetical protein
MTDRDVEPLARHQLPEAAPRAQHRGRPADAHLAELVHGDAGGAQLLAQSPREGERERVREPGGRVPGHAQEQRLDTAEQVPAVQVQDAHHDRLSRPA